ncbi:MAG: TatD family hydrolase [Bryobacteraceae bacterium]|nr:TatD family hydrolase [Bryobacteraceae bacterium]
MNLVDSHCHLDASQFEDDREDVIRRARDAGVRKMLSIGTGNGPPDLEVAIRLADKYDFVYATAGIHPEHAPNVKDAEYKKLADVIQHPRCVAVGEIGIDYHWEPFDAELQASVFIEQMRIAASARKPICIHTRDAWPDTIRLLQQHWAPTGLPCVMHCFTGGPEEARQALDLGFFLSFAGVLTYSSAKALQQAAKEVPLDRILIETDSPYLAPAPYRGKRNEPSYVMYTAQKLAELRGEPLETVALATTRNFESIFVDQLH